MKNERGFTLVETMVSTALVLVIMGSLYMMIIFYRNLSHSEQSRVRLQQESRFLLASLAANLKNAGSVLTLAHTGGYLASTAHFNGIYPFNNTNFADGVILASGDPDATASLFSGYNPSSDGDTINVKDISVAVGADPWAANDIGIIIGTTGYYVFRVQSVSGNSIVKRPASVYYSGLLATANYDDPETVLGNNVPYPEKAPVVRLTSFGIFLVQEVADTQLGRNRRDLVRVVDCNDNGNVLSTSSPAVKHVIADNIWDFQLVYYTYPDFPDVSVKNVYFEIGSSLTHDNLLLDIRAKTLKEVALHLVGLTSEFSGLGEVTHKVGDIGDHPGTTLPTGKYMFKQYRLMIEPRNYNIKL